MEAKFAEVKIGMTKEEVVALLGAPEDTAFEVLEGRAYEWWFYFDDSRGTTHSYGLRFLGGKLVSQEHRLVGAPEHVGSRE